MRLQPVERGGTFPTKCPELMQEVISLITWNCSEDVSIIPFEDNHCCCRYCGDGSIRSLQWVNSIHIHRGAELDDASIVEEEFQSRQHSAGDDNYFTVPLHCFSFWFKYLIHIIPSASGSVTFNDLVSVNAYTHEVMQVRKD